MAKNEEQADEIEELKRLLAQLKKGSQSPTPGSPMSKEEKDKLTKDAAEARVALENEKKKSAQAAEKFKVHMLEMAAQHKADQAELDKLRKQLAELLEQNAKHKGKIENMKKTMEMMKGAFFNSF